MKKRLIVILTILISVIAFQSTNAMSESLIGLWLFDEGEGDTTQDSSTNGNDGEIFECEWAEGKFGSALDFNGTSSYVEVPNSDSLCISNDKVSITAWATQRTPGDTWRTIVSKGPMSGTNENWALFTNVQEQYLCPVLSMARGERWWATSGNGSLEADEKWHHLAMTYDGSKVNIYIDGELKESVDNDGDLVPNENTLRIGWRQDSPHVWNGLLDEVGVHNSALSQQEVKNIMEKGYLNALAVEYVGKLSTIWGEIKNK